MVSMFLNLQLGEEVQIGIKLRESVNMKKYRVCDTCYIENSNHMSNWVAVLD